MSFVITIVILILFAAINYYIGLRNFQTLRRLMPKINGYIYWTLFFIIVFSFIIGRIGRNFLPLFMDNVFNIVGSYWLAAFVYFTILYGIVEIVKLISRKFTSESKIIISVNAIIMAAVLVILAYGTYNARCPKVNTYDITVHKNVKNESQLNAVLVSDLHLGYIVDKKYLDKMVDIINSLHPDIVFVAGDIVDDSPEPFIRQNMKESFLRLKSKYGTYAILGNHEYIGGTPDKCAECYTQAGMKVLKDKIVKVGDEFYVIGRDDTSGQEFNKKKRASLDELMKGADKTLPIIVLDHQPSHLEEAKGVGVDLELSGHTHGGQFYPNKIVTDMMYKKSWGVLKDDKFNLVVTCGYGTWGPPIRIGTVSEIARVNVKFSK